MLGEYDAAGNPVYETVYLSSLPVGVLKQTGSAATSDIAVTAYNVHADHIATPRVITQQDEQIVWRWDTAESFGGSVPDQNPGGLGTFTYNQRFPGQVFDQETGLFQNWNREYNSRYGRYIQSDPIGLSGGINTFAYVGGNPLEFFDPEGLDRWGDDPAFGWTTKGGVPQPNGQRAELFVFSMCMRSCVGESFVITSTSEDIPQHAPGTPHRNEQAMDLRYPAKADKYLCCAQSCGSKFALDEAKHPSKKSTGKHFHLSLVPGTRGGRGDLPTSGSCNASCEQ